MAWLEPENFQCLKAFHGHLAWVHACYHGMPFAKSWCFASNNPCIQHAAARCNHPSKHASIAGVRSSSGQFLSTLTAEYPATLAASLVTHCAFKVRRDPLVRELKKPCLRSLHPDRLKVCDGAGMRSTADHSVPQPDHPLKIVAHAWLQWATTKNLISKILAHVSSDTPEPPLSAQVGAVNKPAPASLAPDSGQPYRLSLLHALATASNDPDIKLLPLLSEGVHRGPVRIAPQHAVATQRARRPASRTHRMHGQLEGRRSRARHSVGPKKSPTDGSSAQRCPSNRLGGTGIKALQ